MRQPYWLIDLDNTLHNANAGIFPLINRKMTEYVANLLHISAPEASQLREDYWIRYGATFTGLHLHHSNFDAEDFLHSTHPIDEIIAHLHFEENLHHIIATLPGKKAVFSNGPDFYVHALLKEMQIIDLFDEIFDSHRLNFCFKPHPESFSRVCQFWNVAPTQCILIEDSLTNLQACGTMIKVLFGAHAHQADFCVDSWKQLFEISEQIIKKLPEN